MSLTYEKTEWVRVTPDSPCAVCGRPTWCTRTTDGTAVRCMRLESARPVEAGGWIHRVDDPPLPPPPPRPAPKPVADVGKLALAMARHRSADAKRRELALELGVTVESLEALLAGIGWDYYGREFATFPSRDGDGKVTGISRRYTDGSKRTLAGTSNSGVYAPSYWYLPPGPVYVVEGPSDVAALFSHGFAVLGRPSNIGGARHLAAFLHRRAAGRPVVVLGEHDRKPDRPGTVPQCPIDCAGCSWCWPGKYGAVTVSGQLCRLGIDSRWAMPPAQYKDARAWANNDPEFRYNFTAWTHRAVNQAA